MKNFISERNEIAREALRYSEMRLESTVSAFASLHARVTQFLTFNVALAAAFVALADKLPVAWPAFVGAGLLVLIAFLSSFLLSPRNFHVNGHMWKDWKEHFETGDRLFDVQRALGLENDERILYNEKVLKARFRHFQACLCANGIVLFFIFVTQIPYFFDVLDTMTCFIRRAFVWAINGAFAMMV